MRKVAYVRPESVIYVAMEENLQSEEQEVVIAFDSGYRLVVDLEGIKECLPDAYELLTSTKSASTTAATSEPFR